MTWWILPLAILFVGAAALSHQAGAVRHEVASLGGTQERLRHLRVALVRLRRARIAMTSRPARPGRPELQGPAGPSTPPR